MARSSLNVQSNRCVFPPFFFILENERHKTSDECPRAARRLEVLPDLTFHTGLPASLLRRPRPQFSVVQLAETTTPTLNILTRSFQKQGRVLARPRAVIALANFNPGTRLFSNMHTPDQMSPGTLKTVASLFAFDASSIQDQGLRLAVWLLSSFNQGWPSLLSLCAFHNVIRVPLLRKASLGEMGSESFHQGHACGPEKHDNGEEPEDNGFLSSSVESAHPRGSAGPRQVLEAWALS